MTEPRRFKINQCRRSNWQLFKAWLNYLVIDFPRRTITTFSIHRPYRVYQEYAKAVEAEATHEETLVYGKDPFVILHSNPNWQPALYDED